MRIPGGFYLQVCIFYIFVPIDKITEKNIRRGWIYYWCVFGSCSMLCNRVSRLFPPLFMAIRGMVGYRREWSGRRIHRAQMLAQLQRWGDTRVKGFRWTCTDRARGILVPQLRGELIHLTDPEDRCRGRARLARREVKYSQKGRFGLTTTFPPLTFCLAVLNL